MGLYWWNTFYVILQNTDPYQMPDSCIGISLWFHLVSWTYWHQCMIKCSCDDKNVDYINYFLQNSAITTTVTSSTTSISTTIVIIITASIPLLSRNFYRNKKYFLYFFKNKFREFFISCKSIKKTTSILCNSLKNPYN